MNAVTKSVSYTFYCTKVVYQSDIKFEDVKVQLLALWPECKVHVKYFVGNILLLSLMTLVTIAALMRTRMSSQDSTGINEINITPTIINWVIKFLLQLLNICSNTISQNVNIAIQALVLPCEEHDTHYWVKVHCKANIFSYNIKNNYSLVFRLSHKLLDFPRCLMLSPLWIGSPGDRNIPVFKLLQIVSGQ